MMRLVLLALLLGALPAQAEKAGAEHRGAGPGWSPAMLGLARPAPALATAFAWHYPGAVPHAAFAFLQDAAGRAAWGFASGAPDLAAAEAGALADCAAEAARQGIGGACQVAARDAWPAAAAPVAARIGELAAAPLLRFRGPGVARGVVIWGHGSGGPRGTDLRATATPGLVSRLNEAGWDVLRFDRAPGEDGLAVALPRLRAAVRAARAAGYGQVVLGGHSRGGWLALLAAAEEPAEVAAVIALSPASWGRVAAADGAGNGRAEEAMAGYAGALHRLAGTAVRLAVAVFDADPYDPGPAARATMLAGLDAGRAAPALALWPHDVSGHGGGEDWRFTLEMAPCLRDWLALPAATAPRGLRRDAC